MAIIRLNILVFLTFLFLCLLPESGAIPRRGGKSKANREAKIADHGSTKASAQSHPAPRPPAAAHPNPPAHDPHRPQDAHAANHAAHTDPHHPSPAPGKPAGIGGKTKKLFNSAKNKGMEIARQKEHQDTARKFLGNFVEDQKRRKEERMMAMGGGGGGFGEDAAY